MPLNVVYKIGYHSSIIMYIFMLPPQGPANLVFRTEIY